MAIGQRIKYCREQKNLTQTELAERTGTTKQNIYKYENGIITNIPSDKIQRMADVLEVSPAFLMGWDEEYIKTQEVLKKLINPDSMSQQVKEIAELQAKIIKAVSKIEDDQLKIDEEYKRIEATRKKWEEIMQKMSDDNRQKLQDYAELLLLKQNQGGRGD